MTAPLLVIAAGGTGGHMYPAQALAEEMLGRGWRVALASDARGLRYAGGFPEAVRRMELDAASPSQGGLGARLAAPLRLYRGIKAARAAFGADRPAVVAGFGGYPAVPALAAAWTMEVPRILHEQNGVLGRVNRIFARHVAMVCCGTWPLANPPAGVRLEPIGNPVRAAIAAERASVYGMPSTEGPVRLLVFGGSQGASVFSRTIPQAVAMLPEALRERMSVVQQARDGEEAGVLSAYRAAGVAAEVAPFFQDMPARLAASQLVIARAGASTVAELACVGRPALLVPYPHAMDDHQSANAAALAGAGGARVMPEPGLTAGALAAVLRELLVEAPETCGTMAAAAWSQGRPGAAVALGDIVQALHADASG
ncbi:MAG: UDP-N-acetylglucosamine--N-acetylmuramyl-(pentapeptide) pyrophosphoryl-undecaprenol N-acetylglucosamine transferase [Pseudomonadota bacterium]